MENLNKIQSLYPFVTQFIGISDDKSSLLLRPVGYHFAEDYKDYIEGKSIIYLLKLIKFFFKYIKKLYVIVNIFVI